MMSFIKVKKKQQLMYVELTLYMCMYDRSLLLYYPIYTYIHMSTWFIVLYLEIRFLLMCKASVVYMFLTESTKSKNNGKNCFLNLNYFILSTGRFN